MELALGASFLYGAYQTWKVQSTKGSNNTLERRMQSSSNKEGVSNIATNRFHNKERILKFWVVMMSMLTVLPIFDFFLGWIFGPLWFIVRLLIFWKVAYSRTLGSGYLFEQYEHYAKYIENNIRQVVLLGRRFRTALIDFIGTVVSKLFLIFTGMFVLYFSRDMLKSSKEELKLLNIALGTELDKVDRPGHKRKARPAEGEKKDADGLTNTTSMSGNASGTPVKKGMAQRSNEEGQKEGIKVRKPTSNNQRTKLRRRKNDGNVK